MLTRTTARAAGGYYGSGWPAAPTGPRGIAQRRTSGSSGNQSAAESAKDCCTDQQSLPTGNDPAPYYIPMIASDLILDLYVLV